MGEMNHVDFLLTNAFVRFKTALYESVEWLTISVEKSVCFVFIVCYLMEMML